MAHSCGLQLMLAVDRGLSCIVKGAHVYVWPLHGFSQLVVVFLEIITRSNMQETCSLGSCKASYDLSLGVPECYFYCILPVKAVIEARPDSEEEK